MGNPKASQRRSKKRSTAQQAVSKSLNKANKENSTAPIPAPAPLKNSVRKLKDYKQEYQKLQQKLRHAASYRTKLQAALDGYKLKAEDSENAAEAARHQLVESKRREQLLQSAVEEAMSLGAKKAVELKEASGSQSVPTALRIVVLT
ncbi:hypothetical protein R3P38DRAFT_2768619 [Favolaschia claudopus]|uniref:Uncharacterized protein n=1 Tax=Favolaschia claudopus TaxID=2862362 RepID=A0AAW0CQM1_9AGAR